MTHNVSSCTVGHTGLVISVTLLSKDICSLYLMCVNIDALIFDLQAKWLLCLPGFRHHFGVLRVVFM